MSEIIEFDALVVHKGSDTGKKRWIRASGIDSLSAIKSLRAEGFDVYDIQDHEEPEQE